MTVVMVIGEPLDGLHLSCNVDGVVLLSWWETGWWVDLQWKKYCSHINEISRVLVVLKGLLVGGDLPHVVDDGCM